MAVPVTVDERPDAIEFSVDGLTAIVSTSPVRISYERDGQPLVAEEHGYYAEETMRGFRFALDEGEKILGGGQRVLGMDRRGRRMPLYNKAAYGYHTDDRDQMYYGLPAVMSSDKLRHCVRQLRERLARHRRDQVRTCSISRPLAGALRIIVIAGDSYPDLIENFTDVTGRQPMPPRWAFGNYRIALRVPVTEKETRDVVRRFQREKIPLDAIILDIYWFGPDIQGHMGNLDWDRDAFPDAEDMIRDFADDGVRTITITEPFILTTSKTWHDAVDSERACA